ncbi:Reverse gyrase 1, partial [Clarias magur]
QFVLHWIFLGIGLVGSLVPLRIEEPWVPMILSPVYWCKIWPQAQRHMGRSMPRACQDIVLGCALTCTISTRSVQPLYGTRRMFRVSVHTIGGVQASA